MKICYDRGCSTLYILLCPASSIDITKIECLSFPVQYSFEHGMTELVSANNSSVASDAKTGVIKVFLLTKWLFFVLSKYASNSENNF